MRVGSGMVSGEGRGVYGFEIPESYGALLLDEGGWGEDVHGNCQMVGDCEVRGVQIADGNARLADQVQCVTFFMVGKVYMLCDVEIVEDVQELCSGFGVR